MPFAFSVLNGLNFGVRLDRGAREVAVRYTRDSDFEKLIGGPRAGHARIKIIAGKRASPGSGRIMALAVQREEAHCASCLRRLKCGLLFFA